MYLNGMLARQTRESRDKFDMFRDSSYFMVHVLRASEPSICLYVSSVWYKSSIRETFQSGTDGSWTHSPRERTPVGMQEIEKSWFLRTIVSTTATPTNT